MILWLIVGILGGSFALGMIAARLWKKESAQWKAFPGFYTFTPALISILVAYAAERRWSFGSLSYIRLSPFHLLLGFLIPMILYALSLGIQLRAGTLRLKPDGDWKKTLVGLPPTILVLIVFVAGEEIGWRGFLQAPLMGVFGNLGGPVVLGLVWGIWHAPVALRGHNLSSAFWAEAFVLYPVMCVLYSLPLAYLTSQSGSLWPALVFHATNNALGSFGTQLLESRDTKRQVLYTMLAGILVLGPFALLLAL